MGNLTVDTSDKKLFHNWISDYSLYCEKEIKIGQLGSSFFLGMALNGYFLKQADKFERKNILILGSIAQAFVCCDLFFWDNLYAKYIFLFLGGLSHFKTIQVYIILVEMSPRKSQVYVSAF